MDNDRREFSSGVELRFELMEFRMFWKGHVNPRDLVVRLGTSVGRASVDLKHDLGKARIKDPHEFRPLGLDTDLAARQPKDQQIFLLNRETAFDQGLTASYFEVL